MWQFHWKPENTLPLKIDGVTAAKVIAQWHNWQLKDVDHRIGKDLIFPTPENCFFILDKVKSSIPVHRLVDINLAKSLMLVVPVSSMSRQLLLFLLGIEMLRPQLYEAVLEIDLVGELPRSSFSQEKRYGLLCYSSVEALVQDLVWVITQEKAAETEEIKKKFHESIFNNRLAGLQNNLLRRALRHRLNRGSIKIKLEQG